MSFFCVLFCAEYPYLSADWLSAVKDRFYDEKIAEVIFLDQPSYTNSVLTGLSDLLLLSLQGFQAVCVHSAQRYKELPFA